MDLAIGKGARAVRRREHRPGIEQGPRAERRRRRRCPEDERFRRDLRQLLPGSASRAGRGEAHRRAQLRWIARSFAAASEIEAIAISCGSSQTFAAHAAGRGGPAAISRRPCLVSSATELMVELVGKSLGGEIGSANAHGRQDRTPGLARRGDICQTGGMAIDREIAELARAIARARRAVVFTGAGISTEFGHSRFPQPRRDLDAHGADRLLGFPRLGGGAARNLAAALRNGGDLSRSGPEPRSPRRRRAGPPRHGRRRDHAEHRRSAPGLRRPRRAGHRAAWQYDLCALPRLQDAL